MSRDWEHDFSNIVKETETNLAKVRQRLYVDHGSHSTSSTSFSNTRPLSTYPVPSSVMSRSYIPSPSVSRNGYSNLGEWRPHSGYTSQFAVAASSEGESVPSSAAESSSMLAVLTDKLDSQNKTIQSLSRQVNTLERERDRNQTQLQRLDQEVSSLSQRLRNGDRSSGGVSMETERRAEARQREMTLQLADLQAQVAQVQRRNSSHGDGSHGDEILNALTREVHDFKRQIHEDLGVCRREMDSLTTRLLRHEADIGNNQANCKDLNRRMDHVDRTLSSVSDSQRSQSRDLKHTLHTRQTTDQELIQLRSEVSSLMGSVDRLQSNLLTNSQQVSHEAIQPVKTNSYRHLPSKLKAPGKLLPSSKDVGSKKNVRKARVPAKQPSRMAQPSLSDSDDLDLSASLSLGSSDNEALSLDLPPHHARNMQRSHMAIRTRDEDSSDAFSEMTSVLLERDPNMDLVDLVSTPSISSIELDDEFL